MRSRRLLLRLPAAVGRRRRSGPLVLALALALASPLGSSAARVVPVPPGEAPGPPVPPTTHLPPPPGTTELVSVRFGGGFPTGPSAQASLSADGRFVAFASGAADLVPGDTNGAVDVFVRDRQAGTTQRALLPDGVPVPPGGSGRDPSISADGRFVAWVFVTPGTPTGVAVTSSSFILVWDRQAGSVEIVRLATGAPVPNAHSPSISGDGRRVAFVGNQDGIAAGDKNAAPDVYVFDRQAVQISLVSVPPPGATAQGGSAAPSISADGRFVAFHTSADILAPGDDNGEDDVVVRDLQAGVSELVSVAPGGGNGHSQSPAISADGRFVAFESSASNLVPGDISNRDVFVRDRTAGTTTLVSASFDGNPANLPSGQAAISADGRIVAWASGATNLVPPAAGGAAPAPDDSRSEIFARDLVDGESILVSVATDAGPGLGRSLGPAVGGNGRYIAFGSDSDRLVAADINKQADVFLRDLPPAPRLNPPEIDFGTRAVGLAAPPVAAILTNGGWSPMAGAGSLIGGANAAEFAVVFDGCVGVTLRRGQSCTVTVSFTPAAAGARTATLQVRDDAAGSPRSVRLLGGGSLAQLEIEPAIGRPGLVVIATGAGFPAGAEVQLAWSAGVTPRMPPVVADADGAFRVQVLIFHNDVVGRRDLVARPADGRAFPEFGAPYLVLSGSSHPPRFVPGTDLPDPPPALIFGR